MANYAVLKAAINAVIKTNGNKEITGQVLNQTLMAIVDSLGENYQFAGVAVPSTNPGTPDQNIFYLATQAGTYTNFGTTVLPAGISMLEWKNNTWSSETFFTIDDAPTAGSDHLVKSGGVKTAIDNVAFSTNEKVKDVGIDSTPTSGSDNLIKSGAVFDAFKNDGGAYDVSVHFPTGGVEGGNTYTLDGAIAMVPQNMKKGGMSIKFVSSSDNKYIQARCMAQNFTTDTAYWQGVDDEPVAGSKNLIESGGVFLSNAKQLVAPDSDFTKPINALLSYTAKSNIDMSREYYLIYLGFRDGNRSRCIIQVKDGLNDLSNITDNVYFDGSDLLIHTIETDNFIFTIDTSLFPNNDTSTFIGYTYHLYKNASLIHVDDEPTAESDNPVKSGGVFSYVGNVEKLETYNADDGIIWDGTSVVNSSNRFNGTVIALQKDITYTVTSIAVSLVVFDHQPNIGDTDGTVVDGSFTADNDGLYMLVTVRLEATDTVTITNASYGLAKDILDKCVQPKDIEDSLNSTNPEKVLSARQGNILGTEIYGTETETIINKPLVKDSYVKTTTVFRDGASTFEASVSENALEGCYCCKIPVSIGDRYTIFSACANNSAAVGFYILTGNNNAVLSAIKICTQVVDLSITENGYLYVNLQDYNNQTDYVKQFVTVTVGGYKTYVHNYVDGKISDVNNYIDGKISDVNSRINHTYPLYGKKLVCLGDSLTEFKDNNGKRYSDYISELFYATTINCGIGGSQFRQRTTPVVNPSTNGEGYAGMDVISMVMAACGVMYDENTPYSTIVTNAANYIKTAASDDNTEIVQRLLSINWSTVDGVILFAGTNDWKNGVGNWGNTGSNDVNTTLGAINKIIELLLSTYKHLKIYWFTPIVRWLNYDGGTGIDADWSDNNVRASGTDSANLRVFSKMIQDEVTLNHIPVCDMYNTLGINQSNFSQYFNDNDGTHPRKGMDLLAKKIATFIISNNTM